MACVIITHYHFQFFLNMLCTLNAYHIRATKRTAINIMDVVSWSTEYSHTLAPKHKAMKTSDVTINIFFSLSIIC